MSTSSFFGLVAAYNSHCIIYTMSLTEPESHDAAHPNMISSSSNRLSRNVVNL